MSSVLSTRSKTAPRQTAGALRRALPRTLSLPLSLVLGVALLLGLAACEPPEGPEGVTMLRSTYEATLNSFSVRETPMAPQPDPAESMEDGEAADGEAAEGEDATAADAADAAEADDAEAAEGDEGAEGEDEIVEEIPMRQDVLLDIVLRKTGGGGRLDGLTLDVDHVDAAEQQKSTYRIYVDTEGLSKGSRRAVSYVLEDVDFTEGDGFAVEVRPNVPPEMYEQYKEYADAGPAEGGEG